MSIVTRQIAASVCGAFLVATNCREAGPAPIVSRAPAKAADWTRFGWDAGRSNAFLDSTGIVAANVVGLTRLQVPIEGTVDASAVYLHGATVSGASHDVFFVTTTYGKTLAIDADSGTILWRYTPPGYDGWAGSYRITNATPVIDPDRQSLYAAAPDGKIRKLAVADGRELWSTAVTLLPTREKLPSPLNFYAGRVIVTTGGYVGDAPPYQGHVAVLDASTGALLHVWNSLCSDRAGLIDPSTCAESGSAIWGRSAPVIDTTSGDILFATGDGKWDGSTQWGDAILELDRDATRIVANYTPANTATLDESDIDLGSTAPVMLDGGIVAQGGKDGWLRLVDRAAAAGTSPHTGGETQILTSPSGVARFTAPAVWRHSGTTWLFAADRDGTAAFALANGKLESRWRNGNSGTSPVVAGGMLYVYDPGGGLRVYDPTTGRSLTTLDCGSGHWNSPIVVDGRIALPEGDANGHRTSGVLDIWSVR